MDPLSETIAGFPPDLPDAHAHTAPFTGYSRPRLFPAASAMRHCLIVGGGIAGLLTARALRQAGARVTLLERNRQPGQESSWAGGGILSPLYPWRYADSVTRLAQWSQRAWKPLCDELRALAGIDPQHLDSGLLIHAPEEETAARHWAERFGQRLEIADARRLRQLEPERRAPPATMLWFPEIAQVRNPRLVKALRKALALQGVEIHAGVTVERLKPLADGVSLTAADGTRWQADDAIICAGAWSGRLLEQYAPAPDIHPVRGQMLLFRAKPGLIRHMMLEENRYIIPRKDGRVLFGSTLEEAGFKKATTEAARQELARLAISRFPALADYPIEAHWAGLRPAAPGGIPYIGPLPGSRHLFINAGHFRNGVVLGPAAAQLVTDLVLGQAPILAPEPYGIEAERPSGG